MLTPVRLPQWSMEMQDATVIRWLKKAGDLVEPGEALVEIESAKVTASVDAPVGGRLVRIVAQEGDTVDVQGLLAEIGSA